MQAVLVYAKPPLMRGCSWPFTVIMFLGYGRGLAINTAKIIAVANQKGGVGKTTSCVNLVCALTEAGLRVLLADMDPQGNSTSGMGISKQELGRGIYDTLINGVPAAEAVVRTKYGDVLPANKDLSGAGIELVGAEAREYKLKDALGALRSDYDYILIDCPPSLELLTLNSLCAADTVLIPVQCEYYALEGLSDLMNTIRLIKRSLNPALEIEGVLLTMYAGRNNLAIQVAEEVRRFFRDKVYSVMIPRNVRLSEAPSHGRPCVVYDRGSRGSQSYVELARELLAKNSDRLR